MKSPGKGLCLYFFFSISEFLLHKAKPDLTLVDVNNNTVLHLACSKVTNTHMHVLYACSHNHFCMCVASSDVNNKAITCQNIIKFL